MKTPNRQTSKYLNSPNIKILGNKCINSVKQATVLSKFAVWTQDKGNRWALEWKRGRRNGKLLNQNWKVLFMCRLQQHFLICQTWSIIRSIQWAIIFYTARRQQPTLWLLSYYCKQWYLLFQQTEMQWKKLQ